MYGTMCYSEPQGTIWGSLVISFIVLDTLLQNVTDLRTMYYDEPHGTIFDSLAGSQKPGNDHGTNCTFTTFSLPPKPPSVSSSLDNHITIVF